MSILLKPSIRLYVYPAAIQDLVRQMKDHLRVQMNNLPHECFFHRWGNHHGVVKRGSKFWYSPVIGAEWPIDESGTAVATLTPEEVARLEAVKGKFVNSYMDYVSELLFSEEPLSIMEGQVYEIPLEMSDIKMRNPMGETFTLRVESEGKPPGSSYYRYVVGTKNASDLAWGIRRTLKRKSAFEEMYKIYPELWPS